MERHKIDGHKLNHRAHRSRVLDWTQGKSIAPIYVEISPTSRCNHACAFCPFKNVDPHDIDPWYLRRALGEMAKFGVKSVMFSGEGEPFLHPQFVDIVHAAHHAGLDVGITTNGVLFNRSVADQILRDAMWVKVSINAGYPTTYGRINGSSRRDFERVFRNLSYAVIRRSHINSTCAIGVQMLVLPETVREVPTLASVVREFGLDYLVVKPFVKHKDREMIEQPGVSREEIKSVREQAESHNTSRFKVIWRDNMLGVHNPGPCFSLPFWAYIDQLGDVWNCKFHLDDMRFCYGNIYKKSFRDIWANPKRPTQYNGENCTTNCRMANVNLYLQEIENGADPLTMETSEPTPHVNFI